MDRSISQRQSFHAYNIFGIIIVNNIINHMNTKHEWKIIFGQILNFKYHRSRGNKDKKIMSDTKVNLVFKTLQRSNQVTQPSWEYFIQIIAYYSKIKLLCKIRIYILSLICIFTVVFQMKHHKSFLARWQK